MPHHGKLIKKTDTLLVRENDPDGHASQYPLGHQRINLKLHSLQYAQGFEVKIRNMNPRKELHGDDDLVEDNLNECWPIEYISGIAALERDRIVVADHHENEKRAHKQIELSIKPVPLSNNERSKEVEGEPYEYWFISRQSCLIHWCGNLLEGEGRSEDYLLAELYVLSDWFDRLKQSLLSPNSSDIDKIVVSARVLLYHSQMDASLREYWMPRDLIMLRDTSNPLIPLNLTIVQKEKIAAPTDE